MPTRRQPDENQSPARPRGDARRTYWVTRKDQVDCLANATRLDILDRLVALGPLSVKELASALGRKTTAIYHHLKQMETLELVNATQAASERGRPAAVYQAAGGALVRLARAPAKLENRSSMAKAARAVASRAAKDYAAAFKAGELEFEGPGRNHWIFRCLMVPSPERLARINGLFDELADLIWTPDPSPGKQLISVAWFLAPLQLRHDPKNPDEKRRGQCNRTNGR